jgi:hypothetical protein
MENATEKFYQDSTANYAQQNAILVERLELVSKDLVSANQIASTQRSERSRVIREMTEWTKESLENADISEDIAQEIANICGFELEEEFEVSVTVEYAMTVRAKNKSDATEIVDNIDFETVQYDGDSILWFTGSVQSVDI